jgi:Flp pilus assembly protein TadD
MSQVALGEVADGLASLATAVRLDPGHRFAWDALGRTYLALGRPDDAERAWERAVHACPEDVDLRIARATAMAAGGHTREAVRVLHEATALDPGSARAWAQLGVVSLLRQDHGTAGEALLTALDLAPGDEDARFHLAVLHVLVGALEEARDGLAALVAEEAGCAGEAAALLTRLPSDAPVTGGPEDAGSHPGRTS